MPHRSVALARASADSEIRHNAHLRTLNLERVLSVALDRPGPFTRAELIEATGLSAPTVGSLATALIEMGVLTDFGAGPSSGGRRPSTMELNVRYGYVGAIHLEPGGRPWPSPICAARSSRGAASRRPFDSRRPRFWRGSRPNSAACSLNLACRCHVCWPSGPGRPASSIPGRGWSSRCRRI